MSENGKIRLLVRGDDIGSSNSANLACIDSYAKGIMRSVELMVVCPWFPEAVRLLNDHPGLDVGVHCALTAEWQNMKWGPLTRAKSLVDSDGYFPPMVRPNANFPPEQSLVGMNCKIDEIEAEIRAQVEMALRHVPRASHMGCHMGCSQWDDEVREMFQGLAREYGLDAGLDNRPQGFQGYRGVAYEERIDVFIQRLDDLTPGDWIFVDHPAYDTPEMRAIGHKGYEDVAVDRDWCTKVFTSDKVKQVIDERGIELISYRDLKK